LFPVHNDVAINVAPADGSNLQQNNLNSSTSETHPAARVPEPTSTTNIGSNITTASSIPSAEGPGSTAGTDNNIMTGATDDRILTDTSISGINTFDNDNQIVVGIAPANGSIDHLPSTHHPPPAIDVIYRPEPIALPEQHMGTGTDQTPVEAIGTGEGIGSTTDIPMVAQGVLTGLAGQEQLHQLDIDEQTQAGGVAEQARTSGTLSEEPNVHDHSCGMHGSYATTEGIDSPSKTTHPEPTHIISHDMGTGPTQKDVIGRSQSTSGGFYIPANQPPSAGINQNHAQGVAAPTSPLPVSVEPMPVVSAARVAGGGARLREDATGTSAAIPVSDSDPAACGHDHGNTEEEDDDNGASANDESFSYGWIDAPPGCVSSCPLLLRCCNRHPAQKEAYLRCARQREAAAVQAERRSALVTSRAWQAAVAAASAPALNAHKPPSTPSDALPSADEDDKRDGAMAVVIDGPLDAVSLGAWRVWDKAASIRGDTTKKTQAAAASKTAPSRTAPQHEVDFEYTDPGNPARSIGCASCRHIMTLQSLLAYTAALTYTAWCLFYLVLFGLYQSAATSRSFVIAWAFTQAWSIFLLQVRSASPFAS
jgi:hypothetical protein